VRYFRDYLRLWGVYVPYKKGPEIPHLIALLGEDEPVEWTEDMFQQLTKTRRVYLYGLKQRQQSQQIPRINSQEGTNQLLSM
jgi:hypothetical protein